MYSPGCGGCYLNRNRNSRSVLGIGYAIAGVRVAHMNQIRAAGFPIAPGKRRKREAVGCSSLISSKCAKINLAWCTRTEEANASANDGRNRETAGTKRKPRDEIAVLTIHESRIMTIGIAKLTTDCSLVR